MSCMSFADLPLRLRYPRRWEGSPCAVSSVCFFFAGQSLAQGDPPVSQASPTDSGSFYVNGIVYQYIAGTDYTVVAAAHSVINHKFVAVKVRVYNVGQQSVTVKPEDVNVEDALAGQPLAAVSGAELARRMRRPYNWARLAVNPAGGEPQDTTPPEQRGQSAMA